MSNAPSPHVGLFSTCLADTFRPQIVQAALDLLEKTGCRLGMPRGQSCCGFTAETSGEADSAKDMASDALARFAEYDVVVAISHTCARSLEAAAAGNSAPRIYSLTQFLWDHYRPERPFGAYHGRLAYLATSHRPTLFGSDTPGRHLLASLEGVELMDFPDIGSDPANAKALLSDKKQINGLARRIHRSGAGLFVAEDLGMLMSLSGPLKALGSGVELRHIAEVLAGRIKSAPIGVGG
ncbi:(Fe-S)-binding protein [Pseudovibrio exalbescens]|uniref:(Fe-S)-binding protein n=1 Tax=Pseudovibrio exalbescens TaxID=197461 RepID=UPI002365CF30|nr:(Fe-S)-binding protein [Pseudovibrio exalbescens]MDD7911379.1 (Fe-S)-binding protein [Pseudovibrio exalbescens]